MPLYNYKCHVCGNDFEAFSTVAEREYSYCSCGAAGVKMLSQISKPVVYEYYSENLGGMVTGPRQKQRLMKAKNVSEAA